MHTADLNVTPALELAGLNGGWVRKNEPKPLRSAAACQWLTDLKKRSRPWDAGLTFEREIAHAAGRADERVMLSIR